MKRYFFTGLTILLPIVVTILVFNFLINLMTKPFQDLVEDILQYYGLHGKPFLFLSASQVLHVTGKILTLGTLVLGTVLVGLLTQMVIAHYLIRMGGYVIRKIPIVNKIYKAGQEVVKTLFVDRKQTFSRVVLVPFPHEDAYGIGMITNESTLERSDAEHAGLVSVFVPAAPNPTMGFMLMVKRSQLIFLDMKVDDALKSIISCGVLFSKTLKKNTPYPT